MKFAYNEHLDSDKCIDLVIKEIKERYPNIDDKIAYEAAVLAPTIDDKPTNDDKFLRYYYLLMNIDKQNIEFISVFNDMYDIYESGLESQQNNDCMIEIIKYISGEIEEFPSISDFY